MPEEWRPVTVDGEAWPYDVSNLGRVRRSGAGPNTYVGRIRNPSLNASGYVTLTICDGPRQKPISVHILVLEAFVGLRPNSLVSNHKDGDVLNNTLENLEYVTQKRNVQHARNLGNFGSAKVTLAQVREIRSRGKPAYEEIETLAKEFEVTDATICDILGERSWQDG